MSSIQVVTGQEARTRKTRTPNFPVAGTMQPTGIYPLFVHPVLPGETLTRMNLKQRIVSRPVNNPLAGSWYEGWLMYVKLTDLNRALGEMFITNDFSTSGYTAASTDQRFFTQSGEIDWVRLCYDRIIETYFVDEDATAPTIDGVAQAKLQNMWWGQNLTFQADISDPAVPSNVSDVTPDVSAFEMARIMGMSEITYEDYLKQYGVQSIRAELGRPEVLRYWRSWKQPVNTVEPSTGEPTSAWIWSEDIRAEKDIYFREPGFLVGMHAIRPKFYLGQVRHSRVQDMWGFKDWFPAYNAADPSASIQAISSADAIFESSVLHTGDPDLWVDHADLLMHGEQFVNDFTDGPTLPLANGLSFDTGAANHELRGEYATEADVDALFVSSAARDNKLCYYEGIAMLTLRGHVTDNTPKYR